MKRNPLRGMTSGMGLALILSLSSFTPVRGDYSPPSSSGSLVGEFFGFVGDFGSWNAQLGGIPMGFLQNVPAANEGEAVLLLFWFWLHDPQFMPGGAGSSSTQPSGKSLASVPSSLPPTTPAGSPIGSIVLNHSANNSSSSLSNGEAPVPASNGSSAPSSSSNADSTVEPTSLSSAGNGSSSSVLPKGGDPSPTTGGNSGSSTGNSGFNAPPIGVGSFGNTLPSSLVNGSGDGSSSGGSNVGSSVLNPPSSSLSDGGVSLPPVSWSNSGNTPGQNDPTLGTGSNPFSGVAAPDFDSLPLFDPVPEPASFTLFAVGSIGLFVGWRTRSRKA